MAGPRVHKTKENATAFAEKMKHPTRGNEMKLSASRVRMRRQMLRLLKGNREGKDAVRHWFSDTQAFGENVADLYAWWVQKVLADIHDGTIEGVDVHKVMRGVIDEGRKLAMFGVESAAVRAGGAVSVTIPLGDETHTDAGDALEIA